MGGVVSRTNFDPTRPHVHLFWIDVSQYCLLKSSEGLVEGRCREGVLKVMRL